jgi:hypothetical protein
MRAVRRIALICVAAGTAFAQNLPTPPVTLPTLVPGFTVDCAALNATDSCKSYNEMIEHHDEEIVAEVKPPSFVCFRPDDDIFLTMSPTSPPQFLSIKPGKPGAIDSIDGYVYYNTYKKGVADDSRFISGNWKRVPLSSDPFFASAKDNPTKAFVSSTELTVSFEYKNLRGSTTKYSLQIRRSTKRFVESYEFPDEKPAATSKNRVPATAPAGNSRLEYTGYCAEFPADSTP